MDAMRVHELARGRRATIRARSWLIVGMVGCVAVAGEMIRKAVVAVRGLHAVSLRAVDVRRRGDGRDRDGGVPRPPRPGDLGELAKPLLQDPETPPDFSTLSDGSQHWKNLDQM